MVNAGTALVASLVDMKLEQFRKLEKVNVEGSLLTLAEAGRRLCLQATGGDIVMISTKNVFCPGRNSALIAPRRLPLTSWPESPAWSSRRLASASTWCAADAVFSEGSRKSGLWAEVGPSRMRARGLDEKGLEEYYRSRNLLKARRHGRARCQCRALFRDAADAHHRRDDPGQRRPA